MAVTWPITKSAANTTADVTFTLDTSPVENDVIFISINGIVNGSVGTPPSGWTNVLGTGNLLVPSDSSICMGVLYHVVTAGEDTANTVTWTLTDFWSVARNCDVQVAVARGVDTAEPIAASGAGLGTVTNASNSTTHVLPAVASGNVPNTGDAVLRFVMADDLSTYTTPAGHTQLATSNTHAGSWAGIRDAATTASTGVSATNITASLSGESAGFTLIVKAAAGGTDVTGTASSTITASASASGAVGHTGTAASTITASATAAGAPGKTGAAASTITATATAAGTVGHTGAAASTITATASASGDVAHTGAASSTITASGTAAGVRGVTGAGSSTITASGTAAGDSTSPGSGAGSSTITATATASGVRGVLGSGSSTITATATATDGAEPPSGAGSSTITASATASGVVGHVGTAASTVTVAATASGARGVLGAGASTITATATIVVGDQGPDYTGEPLTTTVVTVTRTTALVTPARTTTLLTAGRTTTSG